MIAKLISLLLCLCLLLGGSLFSCGKSDEPVRDWEYTYDPYYNRFKDDVPAGKIKVSGNSYSFSEIMVRDKDEKLQVTACNSLEKIYESVFVEFIDEETVKIIDFSRFFDMDATRGVREGNVLTVSARNKTDSFTYEIRIEIHRDKILLIHNGHTYDKPGTYATITFTLDK